MGFIQEGGSHQLTVDGSRLGHLLPVCHPSNGASDI